MLWLANGEVSHVADHDVVPSRLAIGIVVGWPLVPRNEAQTVMLAAPSVGGATARGTVEEKADPSAGAVIIRGDDDTLRDGHENGAGSPLRTVCAAGTVLNSSSKMIAHSRRILVVSLFLYLMSEPTLAIGTADAYSVTRRYHCQLTCQSWVRAAGRHGA